MPIIDEVNRKHRVKKGNTLCEAGRLVTLDRDNKSKKPVIGNTGKFLCSVGNGSLFFHEDDLEPAPVL